MVNVLLADDKRLHAVYETCSAETHRTRFLYMFTVAQRSGYSVCTTCAKHNPISTQLQQLAVPPSNSIK